MLEGLFQQNESESETKWLISGTCRSYADVIIKLYIYLHWPHLSLSSRRIYLGLLSLELHFYRTSYLYMFQKT